MLLDYNLITDEAAREEAEREDKLGPKPIHEDLDICHSCGQTLPNVDTGSTIDLEPEPTDFTERMFGQMGFQGE